MTRSSTPSATQSGTPTFTVTLTPLVPPNGMPTPSVPAADGPLKVEQLVLGPNPNSGGWVQAWVQLKGSADKVQLRIYLPSMVLRQQLELPAPMQAGWNQGALDLGGLPNGLYYVKAVACRGGEKSPPSPALRLVVAR